MESAPSFRFLARLVAALSLMAGLLYALPASAGLDIRIQALNDSLPRSLPRFQERSLRVVFRTHPAYSPPHYRVRLGGSGYENWLDCGAASQVVFARLEGGHYTLVVEDTANHLQQTLQFEIETTIFETWWFWVIMALYLLGVIGVLFYLFFLYRFQQKMRVFRIREHVARDLHDDMGSQLSSISILSQHLEQMAMLNPDQARHYLARIGETARQIMDSMSDIVWSVNPVNDTLPQIAERMQIFGNELLEAIEFRFFLDKELSHSALDLAQRHDFYMIYKEALTNTARYAQATAVEVKLEKKQNSLQLTIADNGIGFDPDHRPPSQGGNGLRNMQARAANLNATLTIQSQTGTGTILTLILPLK